MAPGARSPRPFRRALRTVPTTGVRILIVDPKTRTEVGRCEGPDVYGACPLAAPDGRAACAGRTVFTQAAGAVREWRIASDAEACFARTFAAAAPRPA